ncbi:MAG: GNAT family N-acetyltransferase [Magnetospirillum sp.]|nr:GNAT family N-acetyltransferase [Magnetospirillum sp.]
MPTAIRPSTEADLAAIYAHHVRTGTASFELEPPSLAEMARRRQSLLDKDLPWLVAEEDGEVVGYAYAGPYRTRPAYDWTLEDSIYVRHDRTGRGVGRALLIPLLDRAAELGYRQMVAVIGGGESDNSGSVALHRACGFRPVGLLQAVGWKFGRWVDSMLMQRPLGPGTTEPVNR